MKKRKVSKLLISILIILVLAIALIIRRTPLISIYAINFISDLIVKNWFNLILIAFFCLTVHVAEGKLIDEKLEQLERKEGNHNE